MPKFQSKPKVITAEQFRPGTIGQIRANIRPCMGSGGYEVFNELHQSWIKFKPYDYIRVDDPNDTYPIDADYMAANYDELTEGDTTDA